MDEFVKVVQCLSFIQSISSFIVNIFLCLDFFVLHSAGIKASAF